MVRSNWRTWTFPSTNMACPEMKVPHEFEDYTMYGQSPMGTGCEAVLLFGVKRYGHVWTNPCCTWISQWYEISKGSTTNQIHMWPLRISRCLIKQLVPLEMPPGFCRRSEHTAAWLHHAAVQGLIGRIPKESLKPIWLFKGWSCRWLIPKKWFYLNRSGSLYVFVHTGLNEHVCFSTIHNSYCIHHYRPSQPTSIINHLVNYHYQLFIWSTIINNQPYQPALSIIFVVKLYDMMKLITVNHNELASQLSSDSRPRVHPQLKDSKTRQVPSAGIARTMRQCIRVVKPFGGFSK